MTTPLKFSVRNTDVTKANLKQEVQRLSVVQNNFYTNNAVALSTTAVEISDAQRKFLGNFGHLFVNPSGATSGTPGIRWGADTSANAKEILETLKIPVEGNQRTFQFHQLVSSTPAEENVTIENTNQTSTFITFATGSQTGSASATLLFEKSTGSASVVVTNLSSTVAGVTTYRVHFNVFAPGQRSRGFDVASSLGFTDPAVGTINLPDNTGGNVVYDATTANYTHWGETGHIIVNSALVTDAGNTVDLRFGNDTSANGQVLLNLLKLPNIGDQRLLTVDHIPDGSGPEINVTLRTVEGTVNNVSFGFQTQTAAGSITFIGAASTQPRYTFIVTNTSTVTLGVVDYKIHFNLISVG